MNTTLREPRASLTRSTLELVVASLIGIGALIVLIAEAGLILYSSGIYVFGENLLIVGSVLSVILVISTRLRTGEPDGEPLREVSVRANTALGVGAFAGAALLLARQGGLDVYSAAIGLLIALSLFIALNVSAEEKYKKSSEDYPSPPTPSPTQAGRGEIKGSSRTALTGDIRMAFETDSRGIGFRSIAIGIAAVLAVTCLLRLLAAPFDLLTYVLAPITVFVLPGLALTLALQEDDTPIFVHLALIPVLSITSQLIIVAWLLWLRVPLTPLAMLIGCAAITLGGLAASVIVKKRAERTID